MKLPWPKAFLTEIHRGVAFFNCHASLEYHDKEPVLVPESHAIALMELCEMARDQNTEHTWLNVEELAQILWREIFEVESK